MMSPVYESYGIVGPVSWNDPFGRLVALVMRVSTVLAGRPVAPVVTRLMSAGKMSVSNAACAVVWNGGAVGRCALGAPEVLGGGSVTYGVLLSGAIQNAPCGAACI